MSECCTLDQVDYLATTNHESYTTWSHFPKPKVAGSILVDY